MATGVSPFRTDSMIVTLRRIIEDQPAAMASLVPELPPWFCRIVEKLLSKEPAQRFGSASEVNQLLAACLAHLQQPTSVPLPVFNGAKDQTKALSAADALFLLLRLFGNMLLGRGVTEGWPVCIHPKPPCVKPPFFYSPIWALTIIPVWFFCFLTPIHTLFDMLSLGPESKMDGPNEILSVLTCSFLRSPWVWRLLNSASL